MGTTVSVMLKEWERCTITMHLNTVRLPQSAKSEIHLCVEESFLVTLSMKGHYHWLSQINPIGRGCYANAWPRNFLCDRYDWLFENWPLQIFTEQLVTACNIWMEFATSCTFCIFMTLTIFSKSSEPVIGKGNLGMTWFWPISLFLLYYILLYYIYRSNVSKLTVK